MLLDECMPKRLRRDLPGIEVSTVADEGWLGRRNGDLLRSMTEAGFTHLVTVDRNRAFQQNVAVAGVAVIVMHARTNRIADLRPLMGNVIEVLTTTGPGQVIHVGV
ncbi:MAG: hypothetical protein SGI90_16145 [Candidatus Eisenbacteria bacterium]|nr:hypothetical protein [Candidatus Eisenbacteria bacterium]